MLAHSLKWTAQKMGNVKGEKNQVLTANHLRKLAEKRWLQFACNDGFVTSDYRNNKHSFQAIVTFGKFGSFCDAEQIRICL